MNGKKQIWPLGNEGGLMFEGNHQVAVALLHRSKRGKNAQPRPERPSPIDVGLAPVQRTEPNA